jgi:hypothetical protein
LRFGPAALLVLLLSLAVLASGCNRFRHRNDETVYVSARQTYLHDRVAAVSNRVAMVTNGQKLQVIERGRRFLHVKTEKNEIGWIEEHAVIDAKTAESFQQMNEAHKQDPVTARATLRDDLYLHQTPGRATEHFYLLAGNSKVELLARTSVEKTSATAAAVAAKAVAQANAAKQAAQTAAAKPAQANGAKPGQTTAKPAAPPAPAAGVPAAAAPEPPPMEDWWLARDGQGHTGWLLASRLDVDVPDEIGLFAEGQRIVGAWVLTKVDDPESSVANHQVPEYLTVMSPPKAGLPFDFDQVRVFTWSTRRHRYETAFRLHPIQGYLPVRVTPATANAPATFSFQIPADGSLQTEPGTGLTRPVHPRTINFRLVDTRVERIGPDMAPLPSQHDPNKKPDPNAKAGAKGKAKKKK